MNRDEQWLLEEKFGGEESAAFFVDCKRLAAGEPLGYLIGTVPFLSCTIHLDSKPLIPRVETEYWVEQAIAEIKRAATKPLHVLDLAAGSGCIGVAVARAVAVAVVDFGEIDHRHFPTITKNLQVNEIHNSRCRVIESDLFTNITDRYDFILSNPPYIDPELDRTDKSVRDFEPHQALYGGRGGLQLIAQIIATAPAHLNRFGQLWLEHEPEQSSAIADLAKLHNFTCTTKSDQYGTERYSTLVLQ